MSPEYYALHKYILDIIKYNNIIGIEKYNSTMDHDIKSANNVRVFYYNSLYFMVRIHKTKLSYGKSILKFNFLL